MLVCKSDSVCGAGETVVLLETSMGTEVGSMETEVGGMGIELGSMGTEVGGMGTELDGMGTEVGGIGSKLGRIGSSILEDIDTSCPNSFASVLVTISNC